jgi:riboflavin synthase
VFTGLIETVGHIRDLTPGRGSTRFGIASDLPASEMVPGESIAVDGVCLTVSSFGEGLFHADAVQETLDRSTLGGLRPGDPVNLERALRMGDRLGGHMVQGHVDGTCKVQDVKRKGNDWRIRILLPDFLSRFVAEKGSIAIQGVSLTVSRRERDSFEVAVIPETLSRTTLDRLKRGDTVNVEVDLIARYLDSLLGRPGNAEPARRSSIGGLPTLNRK